MNYKESAQELVSTLDYKEILETILNYYNGCKDNNRLRKFFSIIRDLEDDGIKPFEKFSTDWIWKTYSIDYATYIPDIFLNSEKENNILSTRGLTEQGLHSLALSVLMDYEYLCRFDHGRFLNLYARTTDPIKSFLNTTFVFEDTPIEDETKQEEFDTNSEVEERETPIPEMKDNGRGKFEVDLKGLGETPRYPKGGEVQVKDDDFSDVFPEQSEADEVIDAIDAMKKAMKEKKEDKKEEEKEKPKQNENNQMKVDSTAPAPNDVKANLTFEFPFAQFVKDSVTGYLNTPGNGVLNDIQGMIKEEAKKLQPNNISINNVEMGTIHGKTHKYFDKALKLTVQEHQLFMAGVAGSGKTTLANQISKALGLKFAHISCTAGMSEAHLLGRMVADGSYIQSSFVDLYENGGVFLFDEVDAADANTMLVINSALANGSLSVPNRASAPIAHRHKDFYCICAANTWGWGSNEYTGRNILDAAFLDRFAGSKLLVDYDEDLEKSICESNSAPISIFETIKKIRENCTKNRIRRVVSTRAIVSAVRSYLNGVPGKEFLETFFTGWSEEEKKKAMEGVSEQFKNQKSK